MEKFKDRMTKFQKQKAKDEEDLSDTYDFFKHICLIFKFNLNFLYKLKS
jgi:hypothetical protein